MDDLVLDAESLFNIADIIDGYCAKQREVVNGYHAQIMALESEWRDDETFGTMVQELNALRTQAITILDEVYEIYPKYFRARAQQILERPVYRSEGTPVYIPTPTGIGTSGTAGYGRHSSSYVGTTVSPSSNATRSSGSNVSSGKAVTGGSNDTEKGVTQSESGSTPSHDSKDGLISGIVGIWAKSSIVKSLKRSNVYYLPVEKSDSLRTTDEIIDDLGGGDRTKGSCSSLAFAYAGCKAGYKVLDFRNGDSRQYFSQNDSIDKIANLAGVKSKVIYGTNEVECANKLLGKMKDGKEYYLAAGLHAAIVRKNGTIYEYLELQTANQNGWYPLTNDSLIGRFKCETAGEEVPTFLIDVQSLGNCKSFIDVLGYINTPADSQWKGESGYAR